MENSVVTSNDVAKLARVSQATVSYVLNNTPGKSISQATRKRVLKAVEELNYTPNIAARALKTNRTNCIAVRVATNLSVSRYHLMLQGIRSYLEPKGYSVLLCSGNRTASGMPDYISACINTQADGIIYMSSDSKDIPGEEMDIIEARKIPLAALDCMEGAPAVSSVNFDYFASGFMCTDHLLKQGFKKFIYLRHDFDNFKQSNRERGVKAAIYSMPDSENISLDIRRINSVSSDWNSSDYSHIPWNSGVSKEATITINKIVKSSDGDTCFVSSFGFGEMRNPISNSLYKAHLMGTASAGISWYGRYISFEFSHFQAGFESARSLIEVLNDTESVRKITLKPVLFPVDPDLF